MTEDNRTISPAAVVFVLLAAVGCGKQIGDACALSSDCATDGSRICDIAPSEPDGYCTIMGCDYDTCPSEATCVRFFTGGFTNEACDPATEKVTTFACSLDELCSLSGLCVPRSAEVRYCMKTCSSNGDCRDGYECRNLTLMKSHGGEPVLAPGDIVDSSSPNFCAPSDN